MTVFITATVRLHLAALYRGAPQLATLYVHYVRYRYEPQPRRITEEHTSRDGMAAMVVLVLTARL